MAKNQQVLNLENLDIGDYMDIVTTYKCRFCSFTSNLPQGISNHVRKFHVQQQMQNQNVSEVSMPDENENNLTNNRRENMLDNNSSSEKVENEKVKVVSEETAIVTMSPIIASFVDMATDTITETVDEVTSQLEDAKATNNNNEQINASVGNDVISDLNTGCQNDEFIEINSLVVGEEKETKNGSVSNESTLISSAGPNKQSTPSNDSTPVTKELFLCGQCSVGFNSIEECKSHMIQDHNAGVEQEEQSSKVSVGTQVEGKKKVGRKRKMEIKVEQQGSDSDWDEAKEYYCRGSRSRRNIRPPKALKEDYYLGKRKKREKPEVLREYKEKCPQIGCFAKFKTEASLQLHLKCHVEGEYYFKCTECSSQEQLWKNMRLHLWKNHKVDTDLLTCDVCNKFKADNLSKLLVHKEIHSSERPYTCDVCGKGFKQFSQMRNHQTIHSEHQSDDPDKWYKNKECSICKRQFANQKSLAKHIQAVHSKIKPFVCPYCGHAAARKAMMQLHIRTHTGEKPFKCDVCPYTTGDHNSLRRHKMRHTGQKPYQCQYCPYACIQAISLKMHVKNKHPGSKGIFCCNICTFRTVNETNYKNHMEDHKNGLIADTSQQNEQATQQIIITSGPSQGQTFSIDAIEEIQADQIQGHEIIEIHAEPITSAHDNTQLQMQVQTLESGEAQISADDLAKLSNCEGLVPSDITAAQLIYSALNAISQSENQENESSRILNGVQTSVASTSTKDGVTTHTITFHLPNSENSDSSVVETVTSSVNLQVEDATPDSRILQPLFIDTASLQEIPQGATIQDLAQVSCLIKDNLFTEGASVVDAVTVEQVRVPSAQTAVSNSSNIN